MTPTKSRLGGRAQKHPRIQYLHHPDTINAKNPKPINRSQCSNLVRDEFSVYIAFVFQTACVTVTLFNLTFENICLWQLASKIPGSLLEGTPQAAQAGAGPPLRFLSAQGRWSLFCPFPRIPVHVQEEGFVSGSVTVYGQFWIWKPDIV